MKLEREIHMQYQKAYARGMKSLEEKKKQRHTAYPTALHTLLSEKTTTYRMDLGRLLIPTNLIVGASGKTEDILLYTREFLPVSEPDTPYADSWRALYKTCFCEGMFAAPVVCYEYLGRFYVRDGLKRVSVAKWMGLSSIAAKVVRILPVCFDSREVVLYYEFLSQYRRTKLYQIQFTQTGFFDKFQAALGRDPGYRWTDADRDQFLKYWTAIEQAFRKSFQDSLNITAADALVILLERYRFDQIIAMDTWVLARVFQSFWKEMYALSFPDTAKAEKGKPAGVLQTA